MTIDLGDAQLGQELPIFVQTTNGISPAWPDRAPQLCLFNGATSALLRRVKIPADTQMQRPGTFRYQLVLDASFPVGPITGFVQWITGGVAFASAIWLRILPGGDADGSVIAATSVRRPNGNFLVFQSDAGIIFKGTNPRVQ